MKLNRTRLVICINIIKKFVYIIGNPKVFFCHNYKYARNKEITSQHIFNVVYDNYIQYLSND